MSEARLWKLLRNSEAQPKFTLSYKKKYVYCRDKELQIAMFFMSCKLYIEDYLLLRPPSSNPLNCEG